MRFALITMLACAPALAQTPPPHHPTGVKPIDKGPYTADANAAYQGGGVVLQGAPGAPAPKPQPTPPSQVPHDAVPR